MSEEILQPIIKWAGGKEKELKHILPLLPSSYANYYEPFVGGGSVFTALAVEKSYINDKSVELYSLYKCIKENNADFFAVLEEIVCSWDKLSVFIKKYSEYLISIYKNYSDNHLCDSWLKNKLFEFIELHSIEFSEMFSSVLNRDVENFIAEIKINSVRKIKRMRCIEFEKGKLSDIDIFKNVETSFKSAFYMYIRHLYNGRVNNEMSYPYETALFFFIMNYAYSGMFRYNNNGEFNVPYGGIGYNSKSLRKKLDYFKSSRLTRLFNGTVVANMDFEVFMDKYQPKEQDFVFLDPPYDTEFSTYTKNIFGKEDHIRLSKYLIEKCKAKWMLVIKQTDFILDLYKEKGLNINAFDKTYMVSFMNRNDRKTEHLIITNY